MEVWKYKDIKYKKISPPAGWMESLPNVCEAVTDTPHKKNPVVIVIRMQMNGENYADHDKW